MGTRVCDPLIFHSHFLREKRKLWNTLTNIARSHQSHKNKIINKTQNNSNFYNLKKWIQKKAAIKSHDKLKMALTVPENKASFESCRNSKGRAQEPHTWPGAMRQPDSSTAWFILWLQILVTPNNSLLRKRTLSKSSKESLAAHHHSPEESKKRLSVWVYPLHLSHSSFPTTWHRYLRGTSHT